MTTYTNNQILGINQTLLNVDIKTVNQKTAYWIARNVRIISKVVSEFTELRNAVQKDEWFSKFQADIEALGVEQAELKWKEQLDLANDELNTFGKKETEIDFYTLPVDNVDVPSEIIPVLFDLIRE